MSSRRLDHGQLRLAAQARKPFLSKSTNFGFQYAYIEAAYGLQGGTIMEWMLMPLRRYTEFSGRSRRKEYWMFVLMNLLLPLVMLLAVLVLGATIAVILYAAVVLALIIPGLAVTVRRLHDTDRSGWIILFGLIPVIGAILLIVYYAKEGTRGPNRFGPDPVQDRLLSEPQSGLAA